MSPVHRIDRRMVKCYHGDRQEVEAMKGIVIYSSKTGNTKRLAERLYDAYRERHDLELVSVDDFKGKGTADYDFALIGGYIDKSKPNKKILKLLEKHPFHRIGLFVTMAAPVDCEFAEGVKENLERILKDYDSMGYVILPGTVDPKLTDLISREDWKIKLLPRKIRLEMVEMAKNARPATEEEYQEAIRSFPL